MEDYSSAIPYLSFQLNQDLYAYKISDVVEVIDLQKITVIPKTPPYIMGVINFRGDILPLIDIRKECGLNCDSDFDVDSVNAVRDVVEVKPVDIMPIPNFDNRINPEFAEGIFKHNDNFITVLDIPAVFSIDKNMQSKQNRL